MDLEEATCKAVSGFKPFFSPFFFRQQQYRIIEQKNQNRYRYINKTVYLFPIDWDKSPQLKYFNKQSCIDLFQIRTELQAAMNMDLSEHKSYIDQEMMRILGQMDSPTLIKDYLYLGSEWNASNMDELTNNG